MKVECKEESDDEEISEEDIVKDKKDCDNDDIEVFSDEDSDSGDAMLTVASCSQVGLRLPLRNVLHDLQSSFRRGSSSATIAESQTSES